MSNKHSNHHLIRSNQIQTSLANGFYDYHTDILPHKLLIPIRFFYFLIYRIRMKQTELHGSIRTENEKKIEVLYLFKFFFNFRTVFYRKIPNSMNYFSSIISHAHSHSFTKKLTFSIKSNAQINTNI